MDEWVQDGARELESDGVTIVPVSHSALQPAIELYEDMMSDKSSLAELGFGIQCVGNANSDPVQIDVQAGAGGKLRYANLCSPEQILPLTKPFIDHLQPLLSKAFGEEVVPVGFQFILGDRHLKPYRHRDFWNGSSISLLTPLFEYAPEHCAFHYWKFDRADELAMRFPPALVFANHLSQRPCVYHYRMGEGVLFRGDVVHRTAPFSPPEGGWGKPKCRALLAIVMVAPNRLLKSVNCKQTMRDIQRTSGHHALSPIVNEKDKLPEKNGNKVKAEFSQVKAKFSKMINFLI